jgi:long-chain acyl-CoA synthetase
MNTTDYLLETGGARDVAIIVGKEQYTYNNVKEVTVCIAQRLLVEGVRPADKVGLLGANSLFWVAAYLATLKIGAIAVPLSTKISPADLQTKQSFIQCKVFCLEKRYHHILQSSLANNTPLIFEDSLTGPELVPWEAIPSFDDERQDAVFLCTSGTTASPRVVRLTHRNIQANTNSIIEYLELTSADRMMAILPFDYCFGASLLHTHLRVGGSVVLSRFLYPESVLDQIEATTCTGLAGVPFTYQTLLRNTTFAGRPLKSLRKIQQAGGKLPNVLIKELIAAAPEAQIYVMYGQTEATARLSYLPPQYLDTKLGSIGRGIPGVELQVIGESGQKVKPGEVGEIVARGDNISPGYLNDLAATAEKFIGGALYTRDMATVDEEGFIYITDRKADFIKSYGHRVSSQEIEACVVELPDVVATAVIGVPDLVRGEDIKAFVTLRGGSQLTPEEIILHCKKRLARYMAPSEVFIVKSLPTNVNGKILKSALRDQIKASTPV